MQTQQLPPAEPASAAPPQAPVGDWHEMRRQERAARRDRFHEAGVPVWGVLLIVIGVVALLGQAGLNMGWLFGLALGAWFVYLGVRHTLVVNPDAATAAEPVNWWLVGLGLLIGLGSISSGFADHLVFPAVLIIVGLGILGQQAWNRPRP